MNKSMLEEPKEQEETREQEQKTKEQEPKEETNEECFICFSIIDCSVQLHCNHWFHLSCILRWLNKKEYCPLCHTMYPIDAFVLDELYDSISLENTIHILLSHSYKIKSPNVYINRMIESHVQNKCIRHIALIACLCYIFVYIPFLLIYTKNTLLVGCMMTIHSILLFCYFEFWL
jgi:hypothetical protein